MKGDFFGFSFDGMHSHELGIIKVSSNDGYKENLHPNFEDATAQIPGRDGEMLFRTDYSSKEFSLDIAFDNMTELQFRKMQRLFNGKRIGRLIFDERPYKVYMAKVSNPVELTYICFDEAIKDKIVYEGQGIRGTDLELYRDTGETQRIYKGTGTIEFKCMSPFAKSQFKYLDAYGDFSFKEDGVIYENVSRDVVPYGNPKTVYENIEEWAGASAIFPYSKYSELGIDVPRAVSEGEFNYEIPVYNAGDIDAPYKLYLPFVDGALAPSTGDNIVIQTDDTYLILKPFSSKTTRDIESGVVINTHNHLIQGVLYNSATQDLIYTGNIYNNYIYKGDFGVIRSTDLLMIRERLTQKISLNCTSAENAVIYYDYLYY